MSEPLALARRRALGDNIYDYICNRYGGYTLKNKYKTIGALLAFVLTVAGAVALLAQGAPGSDMDPVVSKSYVDMRIEQVMALMGGAQPAADNIDADTLRESILSELRTESVAAFTPVRAELGQVLLGGEGAEIILRSGRAAGFVTGENGLVNATEGSEVMNGYDVPVNHLLLVPRDDGRGLVVMSDEAWFIVKGGYQIVMP